MRHPAAHAPGLEVGVQALDEGRVLEAITDEAVVEQLERPPAMEAAGRGDFLGPGASGLCRWLRHGAPHRYLSFHLRCAQEPLTGRYSPTGPGSTMHRG